MKMGQVSKDACTREAGIKQRCLDFREHSVINRSVITTLAGENETLNITREMKTTTVDQDGLSGSHSEIQPPSTKA